MKKHLFYPALWGVLTIFLLFACRTEENLNQKNNQGKQPFAVFVPQYPNEKVDYANGFAYLYQNYYNVNNVDKSQQKAVIDQFGVVDFRIHSQLLTYKDGSKAMIFPIRQMGITKGLVMGILENEETNLRYVRLEESYEGYSGIIQNFSKNDKKFRISDLAVASMKKNDDVREHPDEPKRDDENGPTNPPEKTIPEVIIIVPAPLPTVPTIPIIPTVPVIPPGGGGCGTYGGCNPPPPGGGSSDPLTEVSPNIRMKLSDQQKYPRFTKMVKNLEQFVKNNPVVLKALVKNTGLTEAKIMEGLKWGKGPNIAFDLFHKDKYGDYSDFSKTLTINTLYVNELEATNFPATEKTVSFLLAVTVLHEYTHYGDMLADGYKGDYEMGWGFEQDILGRYGLFVNRSNAGFYVKMFKY
ncbi:TPA: hypothetical protein ACGQK4_001411 [Elizabethkingia anophelis]|uniref:hypothetical protein n=1 Tax=Elizabethkingia anophelis TaxID=1117645 RepID=UPI00136588D7|nr:hypothetical protein [Elizabethkingia anophelis]MCT3979981.1 hypothetical protein [Elizabethkingia anophelis]MDV4012768.1 hypothetical protein [Elizabethkingia anophelis]MVW82169.1 hypothetical protein [Elizabethkingia anophelis]